MDDYQLTIVYKYILAICGHISLCHHRYAATLSNVDICITLSAECWSAIGHFRPIVCFEAQA